MSQQDKPKQLKGSSKSGWKDAIKNALDEEGYTGDATYKVTLYVNAKFKSPGEVDMYAVELEIV